MYLRTIIFKVRSSIDLWQFVTVSKFSPTFRYESTCLNFRCVREENEWRVLPYPSASKVIMRSKEINQEPWNVSSWSGDDDMEIERQTSRKDDLPIWACIALSLVRLLVTKHGRRSIPQDILNIMDSNRVRQEIQRRLSRQKNERGHSVCFG